MYGYDDLKPEIEIDEDTARRFALVNRVRSGQEVDIKSRLGSPIAAGPDRQFRRLTWEGLVHALRPAGGWSCPAPDVRGDLRSKTLGHAVQREHRWEFGVPSSAFGGPDVSESGGMT